MKKWFNKLLGRDDRFFRLLESASEEAYKATRVLERLHSQIGEESFTQTLEELHVYRKKAKKLITVISEELCVRFATPIDRDDIDALSNVLYQVPKSLCKIGERFSITPGEFKSDVVRKQISLLCQASEVVVKMTKMLRSMKKLEKIQDDYELVQTIEGDADKLMVGILRSLYQETVSSKEVIILKDIYERLEDTIDFCRDAAKIIFQVALKYS